MRTFLSAVVLMFLLVGTSTVGAQAPFSIDRPTWTIGDTWTYQTGTAHLTFTVLAVAGETYVLQGEGGSSKWMVRPNRDLIWEDSHFFHPEWPLVPGKQWTFTTTGPASNGMRGENTWSTTETIVGMEPVQVPAGTFQAVRIHGKECNKTQGGCGDFDVWYAPQVKYTVKITKAGAYWADRTPRELVSFKVTP